MQQQRFDQLLLFNFAALGLVLAVVGVYGTVSYAVARRSRELGVRMALGARPHDVLLLVSRDTVLSAVLGIALGTAIAGALGQVVSSLVGDAHGSNPLVLVAASAIVLMFVGAAALIGAIRVTSLDPYSAIRTQA